VWADSRGILWWAEVEDEVLSYDEEALFVVSSHWSSVVGYGGEIGQRAEWGESPSLAAVGGEGEVGTVSVGMLVVASGDHAMGWVAEGDGKDAGGVGTVEDGSIGDLPGLTPVGGVEDACGAASGGEPNVGIGGGDGSL